MTRGKIMFIDEEGRYYQTLEFNGDMYPEGHGGTIIEKYEDGGIRSYSDYERFCVGFDKRYFGYADSADDLLAVSLLEGYSVDYTSNWTDYLYVINNSGRSISALTEDGPIVIPAAEMAVFCFQKLDRLVQIKKKGTRVFPKKKFVETISRLRETHDLKDDIDRLIHAKSSVMDSSFRNEAGMLICHEDSVIELLEFIMNDQTKSIEHFVHALDYGRACEDGMSMDSYVNGIDCRSVESLYDSLLEDMT